MQNFLPKDRKYLDHTQKPEIIFLLKKLSSLHFKKLFWRHKSLFWQPSPKIVCQNLINFTLKVRKHIKSKYLLTQFLSGHKECTFENLVQKYNQKILIFRWRPEIIKQNCFFTLKQTAPITVLWSRRMPLLQTCQNLSIGGSKLLVQLLKIIMQLSTYSKKRSSKCSSGCVGGSFRQHAELLFRIHSLWHKNHEQSWFYLEKTFFIGI